MSSGVMSQEKAKETMDVIELHKKVCSKEHAHRNTAVVTEPEHSGIKFNTKPKKVTVVKPFSFDKGPKKVKCCKIDEKSTGKQPNAVEKPKGTEKHVRIATEHLKTLKVSDKCASARSASKERTQNGSANRIANNIASTKKEPCTRHTRARTPDPHPSVVEKSSVKNPKPQNRQSNATKSQEKCLSKPKAKAPNVKPPETKHDVADSCARRGHSSVLKAKTEQHSKETKAEIVVHKSESKSESKSYSVEVTEKTVQNGLPPRSEGSPNAENEAPLNRIDENLEFFKESAILNGEKAENKLNEISLAYEISNAMTTIESVVTKSASKIPRKKCDPHSELKLPSTINLKSGTIQQPLRFESRYTNGKKENINNEANNVQISNSMNG